VPKVKPETEPRRDELEQRRQTRESEQPAEPGDECRALVRKARRADLVGDARDGQADGEEEGGEAPAEGLRGPEEGGAVVEVGADAEVGPEGS